MSTVHKTGYKFLQPAQGWREVQPSPHPVTEQHPCWVTQPILWCPRSWYNQGTTSCLTMLSKGIICISMVSHPYTKGPRTDFLEVHMLRLLPVCRLFGKHPRHLNTGILPESHHNYKEQVQSLLLTELSPCCMLLARWMSSCSDSILLITKVIWHSNTYWSIRLE